MLAVCFYFQSSLSIYAEGARTSTPGATGARVKDQVEDALRFDELEKSIQAPVESPQFEPADADFLQYDDTKLVILKEIKFGPSEILSDEELKEISTLYVGKTVSLRDLYKMTARVNFLYRQKGALAAVAVLPQQDITDGIVTVQLIEGRIGKIRVSGNLYTNDDFIINRMKSRSGELVDSNRIQRELIRINSLYDISTRVQLAAGETFGTSDLDIIVVEPQDHDLVLFTDNCGKDDIGEYRLGLVAVERSVLGIRDAFSLGAVGAEGMENLFVSYDVPLNRFGSSLGLGYDYSSTNVKSGDLKDLGIEGAYYGWSVRFKHPLTVSQRLVSKGFIEYDNKHSTSEFDGNVTFDTTITSLSYGFDASLYGPGSVLYFYNTITQGEDEHDSTRSFLRYNAQLDFMRSLGMNARLIAKLKFQLADSDLLPSSEQFQIGGSNSVRGYTEGLLIGDNGYSLSIEYDWAAGRMLRPFVFVDYGDIFRYKGDTVRNSNMHSLVSAGTGAHLTFNEHLTGTVTAAVPLVDHSLEERDGITFLYYLQYNF
jgi:hemolysin activation/secretion protein